jgi:hypothetical protein
MASGLVCTDQPANVKKSLANSEPIASFYCDAVLR